jgi:AcrR family transcriptional regulator
MSLVHADPADAGARPAVTADAVLDAALTLFAERGYHGTAVSQIAASLGIRTPSLYNHMRSKQDLLEAIIGRTVDGVLDDFQTAVDELSDPVERLRRAIRVYALRHATHRREALVANRDTTSLPGPGCASGNGTTNERCAPSSATALAPATSMSTPRRSPRSRSSRCVLASPAGSVTAVPVPPSR